MSKKVMAFILAVTLSLQVAACNDEDTNVSETDLSDYMTVPCGNPDWETACYTSCMVTIPRDTAWIFPFMKGDNVCIIAGNIEDNGENESHEKYTGYVYSFDGEMIDTFDVEYDTARPYYPRMFMELDSEHFIGTGASSDYVIYDYDGNVVRKADSANDLILDRVMCKTNDGFAVLVIGGFESVTSLRLYNSDCEITDEMVIDWYCPDGQIFEQNGNIYFRGSSNDFPYGLYKIDPATDTVSEQMTANEIPMEYSDYRTGYSGSCFESKGKMIEVDAENGTVQSLALTKNILLMPPVTGEYDERGLQALDKTHFFNACCNNDIKRTDIVLVSKNDDYDVANRTHIVVSGPGVSSDAILNAAVYEYNMSQEEFYVELDDLVGKYGLNTPVDMKTTKLQLMAQYMNGNAPDIFYGDFFDYLYLGEIGIAADMREYLDTAGVDMNTVTPNIYDLMTGDNGEIYQVFTGYRLNGFWTNDESYGSDVSLAELIASGGVQRRFGSSYSNDLLFDFLCMDLKGLYRSGLLNQETVGSAVSIAVSEGLQPITDSSEYQFPDAAEVGRGEASFYSSPISSAELYDGMSKEFSGTPIFTGYPSAGGSIHVVNPVGLLAMSSTTEYPQACCDFIAQLLSKKCEERALYVNCFPVNDEMLHEYLEYVSNPDDIPDDKKVIYSNVLIRDCGPDDFIPLSEGLDEALLSAIEEADHVQVYDWGLWSMINEELDSYYLQNKPAEDVTNSLLSRITVYAEENYG
ncbi:MAG: hypothetical protein K6A80_05525 [Saccharofermentans sp.]|nr:hypothetical protein [Saccharofermentans sp.]